MEKQIYSAFREFGPCPWWVWNGKMEKPEMIRQLEKLKAAGIDEFFIYAEQGLSLNFLEDNWFEMVAWMVGEVKKRNMHVWIYDDLNWPSGTANGMMVREHPEFRSRSIQSRKVTILAGDQFFFNETCEPEKVFIRPVGDKTWKEIKLDNLMWTNNLGKDIELLYFSIRFYNNAMMCSCDANNSHAYRGYCDLLNPDAVKCWMGYIHEKYYQMFPQEFGKTVRGFFFDEPFTMHYIYVPGYMYLPWTPGLYEKFKKRYCYDMRDCLPELFYEVDAKAYPKAEQTRHDYWSLLAEISSKAFSKTIADWCAAHHVESTGHCVAEEIIGSDGGQRFRLLANGEIHQHLKYHQIPGMDLLSDNTPYYLDRTADWYGIYPGTNRVFNITAKQCCSTARYSGAKRVMAEAMGVNRPNTCLNREKVSYDWLSGCGVSMLNDNSFAYSIGWYHKQELGNKSWAQPWVKHYPVFSEYVRTMSRFAAETLQAHTCVFTPESTIRACTPAAHDSVVTPDGVVAEPLLATLDSLLREHVDYEFLFEDILREAVIEKGVLKAPKSAFTTIIVPQATFLPQDLADKLHEFAKSGGNLIFVGTRPKRGAKKMPDFSKCQLLDETAKDFSKALTKNLKRDYMLSGKNIREVFAAHRGNTLLLSNQGTERAEFSLKTTMPGPIAAVTPGDDTAEWKFDTKAIVLEPEQSVLLTFGKEAKGEPSVSYKLPEKTTKLQATQWDYELDNLNNARPCFEIGLAPNGEAFDDVKCWIPCARDGRHGLDFSLEECAEYWVRGEFQVKDLPKKLSLVVDSVDFHTVILNGQKFTKSKEYFLWGHENRIFDIAKALKKGKNTLVLQAHTSEYASSRISFFHTNEILEPIVLHGDFAVQYKDRATTLTSLPKQLTIGDLCQQGLPNYLGDVTLKMTLPQGVAPKAILLHDVSAGAVSVSINGQSIGTRLWGPYAFDATQCKWRQKGGNALKITLSGNLGLLLKRRYGCQKFPDYPYGINQKLEIF